MPRGGGVGGGSELGAGRSGLGVLSGRAVTPRHGGLSGSPPGCSRASPAIAAGAASRCSGCRLHHSPRCISPHRIASHPPSCIAAPQCIAPPLHRTPQLCCKTRVCIAILPLHLYPPPAASPICRAAPRRCTTGRGEYPPGGFRGIFPGGGLLVVAAAGAGGAVCRYGLLGGPGVDVGGSNSLHGGGAPRLGKLRRGGCGAVQTALDLLAPAPSWAGQGDGLGHICVSVLPVGWGGPCSQGTPPLSPLPLFPAQVP